MIYTFTGNGKGKTTAAVGTTIRAIGAGKRVLLVQFLKTGSSENKVIEKIENFDVKSFGRKGFFLPKKELERNPELKDIGVKPLSEKDQELAEEGLEFVKEKVRTGKYDLLVLDEICLVLNFKLVNKKDFLKFLKSQHNKIDIILTGRECSEELIEVSDLVTETKEIKHYYSKGKKGKEGIDY